MPQERKRWGWQAGGELWRPEPAATASPARPRVTGQRLPLAEKTELVLRRNCCPALWLTSCTSCPLPSSSTDARAGVAGLRPGNPALGQSMLFPGAFAGKQDAGKQQLAGGALGAARGCGTGENARSMTLAYSQWYFFLPCFLLFFSFPTPKHGNVVIAF